MVTIVFMFIPMQGRIQYYGISSTNVAYPPSIGPALQLNRVVQAAENGTSRAPNGLMTN